MILYKFNNKTLWLESYVYIDEFDYLNAQQVGQLTDVAVSGQCC